MFTLFFLYKNIKNIKIIKMGCHTWFFKRDDRTLEEIKEIALKRLERRMKRWENMTAEEIENYKFLDEKELDVKAIAIRYIKRYRKRIEKDDLRAIYANIGNLTYRVKGKYYVDPKEQHDVFRVRNYPDKRLWSYEEVEKWLNRPQNKKKYQAPTLNDVQKERLKEWFNTYPDSFICFG
jgi:hypothetical protein